MGLASWAGVEGEKEDDNGSEKTAKVGGRLVHERISKTGGTNEFGIVLGDRFVVSARATASASTSSRPPFPVSISPGSNR